MFILCFYELFFTLLWIFSFILWMSYFSTLIMNYFSFILWMSYFSTFYWTIFHSSLNELFSICYELFFNLSSAIPPFIIFFSFDSKWSIFHPLFLSISLLMNCFSPFYDIKWRIKVGVLIYVNVMNAVYSCISLYAFCINR